MVSRWAIDQASNTVEGIEQWKMADRPRIKVAVLEGDYADLCGLGLPLSLSLQLQLQDLKLSGALWSAKASASGFSVSLYWPTAPAPEKRLRWRSPGGSANVEKPKNVQFPVLLTYKVT